VSANAGIFGRVDPQSQLARNRVSFWLRLAGLVFGFFIQFNVLVGGGGEGAAATGGYGFRIIDFLAIGMIGLLGLYALHPRRVVPLCIYVAIIAPLVGIRLLEQTFWQDPRSIIQGSHYLLYGFSGLYLAIILGEQQIASRFCWGMIFGLFATLPIFILQAAGLGSTLVAFGLVPGTFRVLGIAWAEASRYSGLWLHPNEAGHVAALSAAASAYIAFVQRRFVPLYCSAAAILVVFYYTQSRGGLLASIAVLAVPFLFDMKGKVSIGRLAFALAVAACASLFLLQTDSIASRLTNDAGTSQNLSERIETAIGGFYIALQNPFGLSLRELISQIGAATGGVRTTHNGFIYFAIFFGLPLFLVLLFSLAAHTRIREDTDALFFLWIIQVSVSMMFEQLANNYSYAMVLCTLIGRAFLRTGLGSELKIERQKLHLIKQYRVRRRVR
jgi:hypothetical protein